MQIPTSAHSCHAREKIETIIIRVQVNDPSARKLVVRETQELDAYLRTNPDLKSMCEGFEGWIREHELTPRLNWLPPRQWAELKFGETLDDAELVLIFEETELVDFSNNYIRCDWVVSGLNDVVGNFGYSGELGHIWSMGFYKLDEDSLSEWAKKSANGQTVQVRSYRLQ